ncbi:uncharacterized protein LOC105632409 [Jatropha curcas]|uniref:uncharacterized protein LOC105632409 n=1 Tax=Jatropha curcas TaxID=180498 RepID=UPI0005FC0F3E|nr:uncharacterized protein LOC105632409 [Jatropha curcas]
MEMRNNICSSLGVFDYLNHSRYLGLPSFIGRKKTEVLAFIQERLWKLTQGWKHKFLSKAGKEVSIKSLALAIPVFAMGVFLLPTTMCDELQKLMNAFWWSLKSTNRKGMHWLSWERLCVPKIHGGMGSRHLYSFNLALLGKQGWRIMANGGSLLARIYKAKYFPDGHFMGAVLGTNPSFLWRSILRAKDLLRKEKAEVILHIPLSNRRPEDVLVWHWSKRGIYKLKSAYKLAVQEVAASHYVGNPNMWKFIWAMNIHPKVKQFLWRACKDLLPTKTQLNKRDTGGASESKDVLTRAMHFIADWRDVRPKDNSEGTCRNGRMVCTWSPLAADRLIGASSPRLAELMGLREMDAQEVTTAMAAGRDDRTEFGLLITNYRELFVDANVLSLAWVNTQANNAAHA